MFDYTIEEGTSEELLAYHYRTKSPAGKLFSLNLNIDSLIYPRTIGTILVTNGMIQAGYRKHLRDISGHTLGEIRGKTARIARIVIHPELRGLGFATKLIEAAEAHLREFYPKYKYFEIAAQMLAIKPFVHWSYVGNTSSLADRRSKYLSALKYQLKDTRYDNFKNTMIENYGSLEGAVAFINSYDQNNVDHTYAVRDVTSIPMPVYVMGMDDEHREYVGMIAQEPVSNIVGSVSVPWRQDIHIPHLEVNVGTKESQHVKLVHTMFGTREGQPKTILEEGRVRLTSGEILCILGASGSGKSVFLNRIQDVGLPTATRNVREDMSVIDHFPDVEEAYYYLGAMGLSEAYLYVTPVGALSTGQRYRFNLAYALAFTPEMTTIGIDEFGSCLDVLSAQSVFKGLQRITRDLGKTVILAVNDDKKIGPSRRIKMGYWGSWKEITQESEVTS